MAKFRRQRSSSSRPFIRISEAMMETSPLEIPELVPPNGLAGGL
jgi:hypothetical protein